MQTDDARNEEQLSISDLSPSQRRVLGVLVEKGLTTPEYCPMTLKALTAGCNQKSNRSPVVDYDQDDVEVALDELRSAGLAGEVHTDGGRTPRYRHYVRHRLTVSELQLAVLAELLLRGRQQIGALRSRAGRMVPVGSLDELRQELQALIRQNLVVAGGSLTSRGVEVDHSLYTERESRSRPGSNQRAASDQRADGDEAKAVAVSPARQEDELRADVEELRRDLEETRRELADLREELRLLRDELGA